MTSGFAYDPDQEPEKEELDRRREQAAAFHIGDGPPPEQAQPDTHSKVVRLLAWARKKLDEKAYQAAIARVDDVLRLDRRNADAHLLKAQCLLGLGRLTHALKLLEQADKHATEATQHAAVDETRRRCHAEYLELARQWLRQGDDDRAAECLRRSTTSNDEALFAAIRAYTALRGDRSADGVRQRWLDTDELERVLRWLTREELAAAEAAINDERFAVAVRACDAANRIDKRGAYAALLRAVALFERVRTDRTMTPADDERMLAEATGWARYSERDPSLDQRRAALVADLDRLRRQVRERRQTHQAMEEVDAVFTRFKWIMDQYRRPMLYHTEAGNLLASLAPVGVEVDRLLLKHPRNTPAGAALVELADSIAQIRRQLRP